MKKMIIGLCLIAPAAAMATDFSYNYIEAGYAYADGDRDVEGDGYAATVGWSPGENVYTRLGAEYTTIDDSPLEGYGVNLAIGGYAPLSESIDVYLGILGGWLEITDIPFSSDLDGYSAGGEIGMRAWLLPKTIELDLSGTYLDIVGGDLDDIDADSDDFIGAVDVRVYPIECLSIGVGYARAFDAETDTYSVALRYDF